MYVHHKRKPDLSPSNNKMLGIKWTELFPTRGGFITFLLYISLFVFQGVLIAGSMKDGGGYAYNTTLVVFLSEVVKLVASALLYSLYRRENKPPLLLAVMGNYKLLLLYFIPSLLYCFYNNLSFVNLAHYDPTTYYVLLQFRVVITAFIFQCLFKKKLTPLQWLSLGILTVGCIIKNFTSARTDDSDMWSQLFSIYTLLINFQNFCSCLAGTYNEYLLKNNGADVDIFLQNVFMYVDSIICNFIVMLLQGQIPNLASDFKSLGNVLVILIILNNATVGIVTSFFLKNLNSILKTYASAIELIITAVACYIIFGIVITWSTVLSILLVSIAVVLYAKNPVNNTTPTAPIVERKLLLDIEEV